MMIIKIVAVVLCVFSMTESSPLNNRNKGMEVSGLYEGDIKLLPNSKGLLNTGTKKWPNGIVPYIIDTISYTSTQLTTITNGMRLIENQVGSDGKLYIKFVPRTTETNYIRIRSLSGCWSYMGMIGGVQEVSIQAGGCTYIGTVAHELIHALGFYHEQSRADRDNFITVNFANIPSNVASNFVKQTTNYDYQGINYDLYSIMHYGAYAFSSNGQPTITPKQAGITLLDAYQKTSLSSSDVEELRRAYPAKGTIPTSKITTTLRIITSPQTLIGSFVNRGSAFLPIGDDTAITLTANFVIPVFKTNYSKFIVSTNGYLFLSSPFSTCCTVAIPARSNLISVYNVDLTTTTGGAVYYRAVDYTSSDLKKIQDELSFYLKANININIALVITYENVRSKNYPKEFINTQLILSTNGTKTYLTLTYATCLTSTNLIVPLSRINCLTSTNAAITSSIVNPCKSSNVNVPGKWVFDVSNQCSSLFTGR